MWGFPKMGWYPQWMEISWDISIGRFFEGNTSCNDIQIIFYGIYTCMYIYIYVYIYICIYIYVYCEWLESPTLHWQPLPRHKRANSARFPGPRCTVSRFSKVRANGLPQGQSGHQLNKSPRLTRSVLASPMAKTLKNPYPTHT